MQLRRIYLDSNVIIRAFEGSPTDEIAKDMVGMFGLIPSRSSQPFVTSHITLAETLVHPIRDGATLAQQRYKLLLSGSSHWLHVRQISQSILVEAARLRATTSMKLPDAIHFATAIMTDCSHFLTSDTDFKFATSSGLPIAIRPTRQTLDDIIAWLRS